MAHFPKRFENGSFDSLGLWGPVSSSIDWCERNYVATFCIAELWNTITCLGMFLAGVYAIITARRLGLQEARWQAHGLVWAVVAAGSAWFHGSLSWTGQLTDEVPMMWAVFVWIFCCLQIYDRRTQTLCWAFNIYASIYSVVHVRFALVRVFQVQYAVLVVSGVILTEHMIRGTTGGYGLCSALVSTEDSLPAAHRTFLKMNRQHIGSLLAAFVIWIVDQAGCSSLHALPFGMPNPQLHAWWHILLGWSIHLGYQSSMAKRIAELNDGSQTMSWRWLCGVVPVATQPATKRKL